MSAEKMKQNAMERVGKMSSAGVVLESKSVDRVATRFSADLAVHTGKLLMAAEAWNAEPLAEGLQAEFLRQYGLVWDLRVAALTAKPVMTGGVK
jgi:hypothetical protein